MDDLVLESGFCWCGFSDFRTTEETSFHFKPGKQSCLLDSYLVTAEVYSSLNFFVDWTVRTCWVFIRSLVDTWDVEYSGWYSWLLVSSHLQCFLSDSYCLHHHPRHRSFVSWIHYASIASTNHSLRYPSNPWWILHHLLSWLLLYWRLFEWKGFHAFSNWDDVSNRILWQVAKVNRVHGLSINPFTHCQCRC